MISLLTVRPGPAVSEVEKMRRFPTCQKSYGTTTTRASQRSASQASQDTGSFYVRFGGFCDWPGQIAFSSGLQPGIGVGQQLLPPPSYFRPSSLSAYLHPDHIGLRGKTAFRAVFPLEGVRPRPSWTTAEARLSYSLDIYHYIHKG